MKYKYKNGGVVKLQNAWTTMPKPEDAILRSWEKQRQKEMQSTSTGRASGIHNTDLPLQTEYPEAVILGGTKALKTIPQVLPVIMNPATASTTAGAVTATGLDAIGLVTGLNNLDNYRRNWQNLTFNDTPGIILNGLSLIPGSSQLTNYKNLKYLTDATKNGIRTISQPLVNRWRTSVYNNLMPFSYNETYLQDGKKYQEFTNAIKDFISPKRIVENPKWQNWATSNGVPWHFKYDLKDADKITAIRQEIYKRYLGIKSPEHFYIKNSDGTYSYNFDNLPDYVKQNFIDAVSNKFRGFGKGVSVGDYLGSAGGNVHATITKTPNGDLSVKYFDIFDVNPFKDPNRVVDALPNWARKLLYKTGPDAEYGITVTDTKPLGKLLKDFELSDITGGKPVVVKNSIDNVHEVTPTELTVRRSEMPMNKNEFLDNYIESSGFWDIFPVDEMSKEDVLSEISRITKEAEEKGAYKDYIKHFNPDSYLTEKTPKELSKEFGLYSVLPENRKILQERPISVAEKAGISKDKRKMFDWDQIEALRPRFNKWAEYYGYDQIPESVGLENAVDIMKNIFKRHNTFFRGVHKPDTPEDIAHIESLFGKDYNLDNVYKYVATHGRPGDNAVFVSPSSNAGIYGSTGKTAIVRRRFKLGRDPETWLQDADFDIIFGGSPEAIKVAQQKGTLTFPWSQRGNGIVENELLAPDGTINFIDFVPRNASASYFDSNGSLNKYLGYKSFGDVYGFGDYNHFTDIPVEKPKFKQGGKI